MKRLILLFCLFASCMNAQEKAVHIMLGLPTGTLGDGRKGLKPRPGFSIGLGYRIENAKGNAWSVGAAYSSFSRKNKDQKETFEYLGLRGMPLVWQLGNKKQWYVEAGVFGNFLLHQELNDHGTVANETKDIQRIYFGPSGGIGARLGESGKSRILIGLRDDFGALGIGKGTPLKFNTITLFAGLEI